MLFDSPDFKSNGFMGVSVEAKRMDIGVDLRIWILFVIHGARNVARDCPWLFGGIKCVRTLNVEICGSLDIVQVQRI